MPSGSRSAMFAACSLCQLARIGETKTRSAVIARDEQTANGAHAPCTIISVTFTTLPSIRSRAIFCSEPP